MDKAKILVAEDDAFLREVYQETLSRGGYIVETAVDGEDALTKIKQSGWSLILLDIVMPKLDGISVMKKYKEEQTPEPKPDLLVIFLTNLDNDAEIKEALTLGKGYLIKSQLTPGDLLKEVQARLPQQQS